MCDEELRMRSFCNNTPDILFREEPFLPGRLFPERTQKALEELAVENESGFKKNENELGKTLTKLRGQRDKVEKFLCSSIHLLSHSEHH